MLFRSRDSFAYMDGRIDPPSSLHALDAEGLREKARQETLVLATVGPRLLGCAYLARRPEGLYLGKLAVAEAARGRGLARRLVDVAECLARAHGLPVIELQTRVALTENLRCFAALGFTEHARTAHPGFDQPTSVTLRRPVRAA